MFDCLRSEKRQEWELLRSKDYIDSFSADAWSTFFARKCCAKLKKNDNREPGLFKEEFRCIGMLCLCIKPYGFSDSLSNKFKFSSNGLKKRTFEDSGDGNMAKSRKVLDKTENVTSTYPGFSTKNHCVATNEQTMKRFSYFYPKRIVQSGGINTAPLKI